MYILTIQALSKFQIYQSVPLQNKKNYKLHDGKAAMARCLTERMQQELLESFRMVQGAADEMEKLGWILGILSKNEIY